MTVEGTLEGLNNYSFPMCEKGRGQPFFFIIIIARWQNYTCKLRLEQVPPLLLPSPNISY